MARLLHAFFFGSYFADLSHPGTWPTNGG